MIHHGDLFTVLPTLLDASVDACVTDPPYELGFMARKWDNSGVASRPEAWREILRVLKPGAYLVAFGGTRTFHRMTCAIEDAGFEIRDCLSWLYGSGFPKSLNLPGGLGTALKPSWEPIMLARKPTQGTVAANVQRHGTGALNIDASRIAGKPDMPFGVRRNPVQRTGYGTYASDGGSGYDGTDWSPSDGGRWPANVCLDEEAAAMLDEQSGLLISRALGADVQRGQMGKHGIYGSSKGIRVGRDYPESVGGASRFYYCAKPTQEERNIGGRNIHPTVKPVELMRWLVRLVTPPNGIVLDPFMGSGTTGMACRYELRQFIGIEREAEYVEIAKRRIVAVAPLFAPDAVTGVDEPKNSGEVQGALLD